MCPCLSSVTAQATQPALAFTGDKQKEEPEDLESLAEVCAVWIGVILPSTLPLFQDLTHFENEQDWSKGKDLSFPKRDPGPQALVKVCWGLDSDQGCQMF